MEAQNQGPVENCFHDIFIRVLIGANILGGCAELVDEFRNRCWLFITKQDRAYAGHDGYEDELSSVYQYDSGVNNCKQVKAGDLFILRTSNKMLGAGQITEVTSELGTKVLKLCPVCKSGHIKPRKTRSPVYACQKKRMEGEPQHVFDNPIIREEQRTLYRAWFGSTFKPFPNAIPVKRLRKATNNSTQNSITRIDLAKLAHEPDLPLELRRFTGGYLGSVLGSNEAIEDPVYQPDGKDQRVSSEGIIKQRRGQQKFRDNLRSRYGDRCMISGSKVMDVVEAAHIAPYLGEKDNAVTNGLLLRSDLHTLFDLNLLGIHPESLQVHIHDSLKDTEYQPFHLDILNCDSKGKPAREALSLRWIQFLNNPSSGVHKEIIVLPQPEVRWKTHVPRVDLQAAAGAFGESRDAGFAYLREAEDWMQVSGKISEGYFAATVKGQSMEPQIPDGSLCLFAPIGGATKQNQVVLASLRECSDSEHGGSYTVKVYRSEKRINSDGVRENTHVILSPKNPAFEPMIFAEDDDKQMAVIGLFRRVL